MTHKYSTSAPNISQEPHDMFYQYQTVFTVFIKPFSTKMSLWYVCLGLLLMFISLFLSISE